MNGRSRHIALWALVSAVGCDEAQPDADPAGPPPPAVEVRANVDNAVATTGDLLTYEVVVERQRDIAVELPDPGDRIAGFRIVDMGQDPPREHGDRVSERRWYSLRADLVGSYILPPVSVSYLETQVDGESQEKTLSTSEIFVEVASVLPADGSAQDIRGIKPLEPVPSDLSWWWAAVVVLVLVVAGPLLWWWRRRQETKILPPPAPHEIAFAALNELRATDFTDQAAMRAYYFNISEVLRAYVEGRFLLNATDLTSEEIMASLDGLRDLRAGPRQKLEGFLLHTDLVKFADQQPSTHQIGETYEQALSFVEETMVRPELAAGPGAEQAEGSP